MSIIDLFTEAEREAVATLAPELRQHALTVIQSVKLVEQVLILVVEAERRHAGMVCRVQAALLVELANTLRASLLAAQFGYPSQAAALVSSIFECAFTIAFISDDERLAKEWVEHDDPTRAFRSVPDLIRGALQNAGVDIPQQATHLYRYYAQLCMAKHMNPWLIRRTAFATEGNALVVSVGPKSDEVAVRVSVFALEQAIGACMSALRRLLGCGMIESPPPEVDLALSALEAEWQQLRKDGLARWGTEDPLPGRWRSISDTPRGQSP